MKGANDSTGYGQLEELKKFCEDRGIKIEHSNKILRGDIVYIRRLNKVFINALVYSENINEFEKQLNL